MGTGDHAGSVLRLLGRCQRLVLENNPWELPPAAVVDAGIYGIRGYYEELNRVAKSPSKMQSLKVVFAGHSGAGKTSLIKTIKAGCGQLTTAFERESVGVSVSDHTLEGQTAAKLYDLAGQADYYGLHQLFMTDRAVYLLTWDASKFLRQTEALVLELMEWLAALHLRAPRSTVILVGTHRDKCEGGGWCTKLLDRMRGAPSLTSVINDIEKKLKDEHEAWKNHRRNANVSNSTDEGLTVEEGIVLVSSSPEAPNGGGVSKLLTRLRKQEGTTSFIPPSWKMALVVLDAVRDGLDPVLAASGEKQELPQPNLGNKRTWVAKEFIMLEWQRVQESLRDDLKAGDPKFAMESALDLREYGGSLLRHLETIFLDVEDFALRLASILNHKTDERDWLGKPMFGGKRLIEPWQQDARKHLVDKGILHRCFARFLWHTPTEPFPEATFKVLVKLGILLPVENGNRWDGETTTAGSHLCGQAFVPAERGEPVGCGGRFLVLMRLPLVAPTEVVGRVEAFVKLQQQWGVVAKWEFDRGSAPHGLVERLIASCHVIADVVEDICWRGGACFVAHEAGKEAGGGSYALALDFNETLSENIRTSGTLTVRAFGNREGKAAWGAIRFAISAVWRIFRQFPGLGWDSWVECPADPGKLVHYLPGPRDIEARSPGTPIVEAASSAAHCRCSTAAGLAKHLGDVVPYSATLGEVFQLPAGHDGGVRTSAAEVNFTAALDGVLRVEARSSGGGRGAEGDIPPTVQGSSDWVKDYAIGGPIGVLSLVVLWEPMVEMVDRWTDGGSLASTLPLTVFLGVLVLTVAIPLCAVCCRQLRRRLNLWPISHVHEE